MIRPVARAERPRRLDELLLSPRARPGAVVAREGVRRGLAVARREATGASSSARSSPNLIAPLIVYRDDPDPPEHPLRGRPVLPGRRHRPGEPQLGGDDQRRHIRSSPPGLVVHDVPRPGAAHHRIGLQLARGWASGRPQPALHQVEAAVHPSLRSHPGAEPHTERNHP